MENESQHEKKHIINTTHTVKKKEDNNYWKYATIALGVLLVVSLFFNSNSSDGFSINDASEKALGVINTNLLAPGVNAKISEQKEENGVYRLTLDIAGQETDSYVSKDGKLLFISAVELDNPPDAQAPSEPSGNSGSSAPTVKTDVSADDDAVKGDPNAPVTIIEFSDFECPYCGRFYSNTLWQIEEKYINTGKVKLIYRDYPLSFHSNAQKAAEAAECAGDQDKYWEMHNMLFEKGVAGGVNTFKKYASSLGLDTDKFNECLDSDKYYDETQKDLKDGEAYGVTGTPAFFINGRKMTGAQPFSAFQSVIEEELAK